MSGPQISASILNADFGQLASQLSEDPGSKADSGFLPPGPKGRFVASFDSDWRSWASSAMLSRLAMIWSYTESNSSRFSHSMMKSRRRSSVTSTSSTVMSLNGTGVASVRGGAMKSPNRSRRMARLTATSEALATIWARALGPASSPTRLASEAPVITRLSSLVS